MRLRRLKVIHCFVSTKSSSTGQRKNPTINPSQKLMCHSPWHSSWGNGGRSGELCSTSWRTQIKADDKEPLAAEVASGLPSINDLNQDLAPSPNHMKDIYIYISYIHVHRHVINLLGWHVMSEMQLCRKEQKRPRSQIMRIWQHFWAQAHCRSLKQKRLETWGCSVCPRCGQVMASHCSLTEITAKSLIEGWLAPVSVPKFCCHLAKDF